MNPTSRLLSCLTFITLLITGCSLPDNQRSQSVDEFMPPVLRKAVVDDAVMGKWSRSCALCHITGEAGAPLVGDTADWQRRLQQGEEAIINNVLNGANSMPPLGY